MDTTNPTVIISNNRGNVNIILSKKRLTGTLKVQNWFNFARFRHDSASKKPDDLLNKWTEKKITSRAIAKKMYQIGEGKRGYRMSNCAEQIQYSFCSECNAWQVDHTNLCRDRLCPVCSWRLSLKRFVIMSDVTGKIISDYPSLEYSFVTLTLKNCAPDDLNDTLTEINQAWKKIRERRTIRHLVAGSAKSIEITYNDLTKTFHPHVHVIIAWKPGGMSTSLISSAWLELLGVKAVIAAQDEQIITVDSGEDGNSIIGSVLETFKYAVKSKDMENMPLYIFKKFVGEISGRQLVTFSGVFRTVAREFHAEKEMERVSDEETITCKQCKSIYMTKAVAQWCGTGYKWL